jgi:hypothetical protein
MSSRLAHPVNTTHPQPAASAAGREGPLTFADLAARLQLLQPPVAYRLSLDSGVGYKNVRRALEQPMAIRLHTWGKLLRSLRIRMVAAARADDDAGTRCVAPGIAIMPGMADAGVASLRSCRLALGWSRRELARRAGVGLDAVASLEAGCGLAGTLSRVCDAMGLQLLLALPPDHRSLEQLWEERAKSCLTAPAQFPPARPLRGSRGPWRSVIASPPSSS